MLNLLKNYTQLTIGENLLYQNLPENILAKLNRLINRKPLERILSKLHPSFVGRPAYNPLLIFHRLFSFPLRKRSARSYTFCEI